MWRLSECLSSLVFHMKLLYNKETLFRVHEASRWHIVIVRICITTLGYDTESSRRSTQSKRHLQLKCGTELSSNNRVKIPRAKATSSSIVFITVFNVVLIIKSKTILTEIQIIDFILRLIMLGKNHKSYQLLNLTNPPSIG